MVQALETSVHSEIAWARLAGYPAASYYCVCSYTAKEKLITTSSENGCPNSVFYKCFTRDNFNCSLTGDLRQACDIIRLVAYERDAHMDETPIQLGVGSQSDSHEPDFEDGRVKHFL